MEQPDHVKYTSLSIEGQAAVGRIAIWAAWIESGVANLVMEMVAGENRAARIVTRDLGVAKLMQLSRELVRNPHTPYSEESQEALNSVMTRAKSALEKRNKILHGAIGSALESGSVAFHSRRAAPTGLSNIVHVFTEVELDQLSAELFQLTTEVLDLESRIYMERKSWGS